MQAHRPRHLPPAAAALGAAAAAAYEEADDDEGVAAADAAADAGIFAAAIQNSAREVGLAIFEAPTLTLHLCQFAEPGRSFDVTRMHLEAFRPACLVVCGGAAEHQARCRRRRRRRGRRGRCKSLSIIRPLS
jgi:hypothetical protein